MKGGRYSTTVYMSLWVHHVTLIHYSLIEVRYSQPNRVKEADDVTHDWYGSVHTDKQREVHQYLQK